jgi:phytoene/squalene synthetase
MTLFDQVSTECSKITTNRYSTSFSLGIRLLGKNLREPIYSIYGFVRFADEIVDTFHNHNKRKLLDQFKKDTISAINEGISLNPILHSFQLVVNKYNIDFELIECFLNSMEMDLQDQSYNKGLYEKYILGSAEVVGLMCLQVFTNGDKNEYEKLKPFAMALGSAFQKINFLRDLKNDYFELGRSYFPGFELNSFNEVTKDEIEKDIEKDFNMGLQGIKMLPVSSRLGVYVAYVYYNSLFKKIRNKKPQEVLESRIRIPDIQKLSLLVGSYFKHQLNLI